MAKKLKVEKCEECWRSIAGKDYCLLSDARGIPDNCPLAERRIHNCTIFLTDCQPRKE